MIVLGSFATKAAESLAVLNFDIIGKSLSKQQFISITRTEIAKLDTFQVLDKYTVQEALDANPIDLNTCYGTKCLSKAGKNLSVKYIVAGTAEVIVDKAIITLRLIDVETGESVKTAYSEFFWSEPGAQRLIQLSVYKLFDREIERRWLNLYDYETVKNAAHEGPQVLKYNLSGPRFGATYQTGRMNSIVSNSKNKGGFDKNPFTAVIGYQVEKQYLYTGSFQAVFQANFSIAGLDQQSFIPSFAVLHGFRLIKGGWEFGFGPSFRFRKMAEGYYDNGAWTLLKDAPDESLVSSTKRLDSRGKTELFTSWIWAVGKSFKAGSMNIPVNIYTIPDKDGWLVGLSMGYALNMKNK